MTTKFFSRFVMLGLLALTVAACSKKTIDYAQLIPSDADAVVAFDFESLGKKAGLDAKENEELKTKLMDALKSGLKAETLQQVEKILKEPAESGISIKDKVFFFGVKNYPVFLAKVADESKLRNTFKALVDEQMAQPVTDEDGYSSITLNNSAVCIFNQSALMITEMNDSAKEYLVNLLKNEKTDTTTVNKGIQQMMQKKGDMLFYASLGMLEGIYANQITKEIPQEIDLKTLSIIGNLSFDNGKVSLGIEPYTDDAKTKAYIEKQNAAMGMIKGDFLSEFPASALALLSMNIDGKQIYSLIEKNEEFTKNVTPEQATDVKTILESFKGDLSIALLTVTMGNSMPTFVAYAEADNASCLDLLYQSKDMLGLGSGESITKLGQDEYVLDSHRTGNIYFGYKNKNIYVTNDEALYKNIGTPNAAPLKDARYAGNIKGNKYYFIIDAEHILQLPVIKMLVAYGGREASTYFDIASRFSYFEAMGDAKGNAQLNLILQDKDTNSLKQIVDFAKAFVKL